MSSHGLAVYCKGQDNHRYLTLEAIEGQPGPRERDAKAIGFEIEDGTFVMPGSKITLNQVKAVYPEVFVRDMEEGEVRGPASPSVQVALQDQIDSPPEQAAGPAPHHMTRAQFVEKAHVFQGEGGWHVGIGTVEVEVPEAVRILSPRTRVDTIAGHVHEALVLAADRANPKDMRLEVLADYPNISWRGSLTRGRQHSVNVTKLLQRTGIAAQLVDEFDGEEGTGYCVIYNPPYQRLSIELLPYANEKYEGKALYLTHYRDDGEADGEMVYGVAMGRLWLVETAVNFYGERRGCDASFANMFSKNLLAQGFDKPGKATIDFPRKSRQDAIDAYEDHPEMFGRSRAEDEAPEPQLRPGV
ncbi:hypothetical protein ACW0US_17715 [Xanthomonas euvesicatoria]